jgi:hypothetical protein
MVVFISENFHSALFIVFGLKWIAMIRDMRAKPKKVYVDIQTLVSSLSFWFRIGCKHRLLLVRLSVLFMVDYGIAVQHSRKMDTMSNTRSLIKYPGLFLFG